MPGLVRRFSGYDRAVAPRSRASGSARPDRRRRGHLDACGRRGPGRRFSCEWGGTRERWVEEADRDGSPSIAWKSEDEAPRHRQHLSTRSRPADRRQDSLAHRRSIRREEHVLVRHSPIPRRRRRRGPGVGRRVGVGRNRARTRRPRHEGLEPSDRVAGTSVDREEHSPVVPSSGDVARFTTVAPFGRCRAPIDLELGGAVRREPCGATRRVRVSRRAR